MWKWGSGDDSASRSGVHGTPPAANMSVADLAEQLSQTEQLVAQLKALVKDKENELHHKEQQLKDEKVASDSKISKLKLQNKAKVTSLTAQLEELKKQLSGAGTKEGKHEQKKGSREGEQENAAASRGKILVLRKKIEELEAQNSQRNEELQKKIADLEAARQRGAEMDAMLAEKQKKLDEKEAYIVDLQLACGPTSDAKDLLMQNNELKSQLSAKEASLQSLQGLVQNLMKKVGENEERCSLLQEEIEALQTLRGKEKERFQAREAMYTQNILMFQKIIQEKEQELTGLAQKHEQELFKMAAKSDASADLEQLLKALKQKLHEKEEVMLGRTQVIDVLQRELDAKDQELKETQGYLSRLQSEKENLRSKLDAEKHVLRAQLRDLMEKHEQAMDGARRKHEADAQAAREKHETELQEKDQALRRLQRQLEQLGTLGAGPSGQAAGLEAAIQLKLEQLEAQVKLKTEEASKSEARLLKTKAWSKSRIKYLEDDLKKMTSKNNDATALNNRISALEQEKEALQAQLQTFSELKAQNEEFLAKLELYEEQQRKLQADLEQVTKRAASQPSESGSVEELQSRLLEWQEIVTESEDGPGHIREEKTAMALRMAQIEEEREAVVSGHQELEEELAPAGPGTGSMEPERRRTRAQAGREHQEGYGFGGKECFEEVDHTLDSGRSAEGENMGGLQTVVEELEMERNQLQEQILFLEERSRDLEDRFQLQGRMETLQIENDRLQSQLTQLRSQQDREAEKHHLLVSGLNEQLKGLKERNGLLETWLGEKEQQILRAAEKLEELEDLRNLLRERDLLSREQGEKLLQTEQNLEDALKKCGSYAAECAEQKATVCDLTEKIAVLKEKRAKQEADAESMRLELEQSNDDLDRLSASHLEERSQLIQDLQRREREMDNLKDVLAEKGKETLALSCSLAEFSEQVNLLKGQVQRQEGELREVEEARAKAERQVQLLKDVQSVDVKDASAKLSGLSEQLRLAEAELAKEKVACEAKAKEKEELVRQVKESSKTIKELNSELKARDVSYHNRVAECESQIRLLNEQRGKSAEKLQEAQQRLREETERLRSQLDEHISAKEALRVLLKEAESKERGFENELKAVKDLYNQQTLENAKKEEELSSLSRRLAEHAGQVEKAEASLQEKAELVTSLKDQLEMVERQKEKEKLKLEGELEQMESQRKELETDLQGKCDIIRKMEAERQTNALALKQWQAAVEEKERGFMHQLGASEDLKNELHTLEKEKQQLISENESLSKLLDVKECELLKRAQSLADLESKVRAGAAEQEQTLSSVRHEREVLKEKVEELSGLLEQRESSVAEQLLERERERERESRALADELSKSRERAGKLQDETQSLHAQLQDARDRLREKEAALSQKEAEGREAAQQLSRGEGEVLSLEKQVQNLRTELEASGRRLEERKGQNDALLSQVEAKQVSLAELGQEVERLSGQLAEKDSALSSRGTELENLRRQLARKAEESVALREQLALLAHEGEVLKGDRDKAVAACHAASREREALQRQWEQQQSEVVSARHEARRLESDNAQLRTDLGTLSDALRGKCEGLALLNAPFGQQNHKAPAWVDQIEALAGEIETLRGSVSQKETLLSQKEVAMQQMSASKEAGEKHYLQAVSDLQSQVQALGGEVGRLRQEVQGKEEELKRQSRDLKTLKDKSEEAALLRVQLSENMETISDLQGQIKDMAERAEELRQSMARSERCLKEREGECAELQARISASSGAQQNLAEALTSESEKLKAVVLEKESLINNTLQLNSKLEAELQDKETECEALKKQAAALEETHLSLKTEIQDQKKLVNDLVQQLDDKEASLLEKVTLVEKLKEEARINEDNVSKLQDKINEMGREMQTSEERVQEKEGAFRSLQDKFASQHEEKSELRGALSRKEALVAELRRSLQQKEAGLQLAESKVQTLTRESELLREEVGGNAAALGKALQEKDESLALSQEKLDVLAAEVESARSEHQKTRERAEVWQQKVQQTQRELRVAQDASAAQAKEMENLRSELSLVTSTPCQECQDYLLRVGELQQQVDSGAEGKALLQGSLDKLTVENRELAKGQNHLQQELQELRERHEAVASSERDSRTQLQAVALQLERERAQRETQVSAERDEVEPLKLEVEKLERELREAEDRWVAERDRITRESQLGLERLRSLERELERKDLGLRSLQQERDMVQKELARRRRPLSGDQDFPRAGDTSVVQKAAGSLSVLEEVSTVVDQLLSREAEATALREALSGREREIRGLNSELEAMQSLREEKELAQSALEKTEGRHRSEVESWSTEVMATKEALCEQQRMCEERDAALTDANRRVAFLQEKTDRLEKELENGCQMLDHKCREVAKYSEELEWKKQLVENLASQTNRQKDLIATLSQQLKEKECSVTQVMESVSDETRRFSEEKSALSSRLRQLESIRNSTAEEARMLSQELEDSKKALEFSQNALSDKEATIQGLLEEKARTKETLDQLSQEKEKLKRKLQAALVRRKDLMEKVVALEKGAQEQAEREGRMTRGLQEQIGELTGLAKAAEAQNRSLESQLDGLKEQMAEKEAEISDMREVLSDEAKHVDRLQRDVAGFQDTIAAQKSRVDENLIRLQEKDSLLEQMRSVLTEKEETYREERSHLCLTIENLKAEMAKKEEALRAINASDATLETSDDDTHREVHQLRKEKDVLQKKLQALLAARKESAKKIQRHQEERATLLAHLDERTKDLARVRKEHGSLQEMHERKCEELDSTLLLLRSLQERLENSASLQHGGHSEPTSPVAAGESENAASETEMAKPGTDKYAGFVEEKERFEEELRDQSLQADRKGQELTQLKRALEPEGEQSQEDRDRALRERGRLLQDPETYGKERAGVQTVTESLNSGKEAFHAQTGEREAVETVEPNLQIANAQIPERDEEIRCLPLSLEDLQDQSDHGKEMAEELSLLQPSGQQSQEETRCFETASEKTGQERKESAHHLEKPNAGLASMKEELQRVREENQELLIELNMLRKKILPVSSAGKHLVVGEGSVESTWHPAAKALQGRAEEAGSSTAFSDAHRIEKELLSATRTEEVLMEGTDPIPAGTRQKMDTEGETQEHLRRTLQAALMSRQEVAKENKTLKEQIEALLLENEERAVKGQALPLLATEVRSRGEQEGLLSAENARLATENENLVAACGSLKATMEALAQERAAFSFQLDSLKDSQTVELNDWKAKHGELRQEYESLLQAYENVSGKIADMGQAVGVARKGKQEALQRAKERETDNRALEERLQKATDESVQTKERLVQCVESTQKEIGELRAEAEKQASEHRLRFQECQGKGDAARLQSEQLVEENRQLKEMSDTLKLTLEQTVQENAALSRDFGRAGSALRDLQRRLAPGDLGVESETGDSRSERDPLFTLLRLLNEGVSVKEEHVRSLRQENQTLSERLTATEASLRHKEEALAKSESGGQRLTLEVASLCERIKILEDDKGLLQEELEHAQETSCKGKSEREVLETELLSHAQKLDQATGRLEDQRVQIHSLTRQLSDLRAERGQAAREKEEQRLNLVREFEEQVKSARRDTSGTRSKAKELQELLKEKQREINQLQTDSIRYQEMIGDLEKSAKLAQSRSEKLERDLTDAKDKLGRSNEEMEKLMEKLSLQKAWLEGSKAEVEQLARENLNNKKELKKKESQLVNQKREYESQLELALQEQKASCQKEMLNLEERRQALQGERERVLGERRRWQEEMGAREAHGQGLRAELNDALARLAAFAKCMSSLQGDRDRVLEERKRWEAEVKETIAEKQRQIEGRDEAIASLREEREALVARLRELQLGRSLREEERKEPAGIKAENNSSAQKSQREREAAMTSKEEPWRAPIQEKESLDHWTEGPPAEQGTDGPRDAWAGKEENHVQQLLLGGSESRGELQKQVALSPLAKAVLAKEGAEPSLRVLPNDPGIAGAPTRGQTRHREQVPESAERRIEALPAAGEESGETRPRTRDEGRALQAKAQRAGQDGAEMAGQLDALKKAMCSLQGDREALVSQHQKLESDLRAALCEKERLAAEGTLENGALRGRLRELRNQRDDLHSENAMLAAQLAKYRDDLRQVLSLKDSQLKELLARKMELVKNLEQEKLELRKELSEARQAARAQEETSASLRRENRRLAAKACDLETVVASVNKARLVFPDQGGGGLDREQLRPEEKREAFRPPVGPEEKDAEEADGRSREKGSAQGLLGLQFENNELRAQLEPSRKAMAALQADRERSSEDFTALRGKDDSELRLQKRRADKLEAEARHFRANVLHLLNQSPLGQHRPSLEAGKEVPLDQLADELETLWKLLATRTPEVGHPPAAGEDAAQPWGGSSGTPPSLQKDRGRILQDLGPISSTPSGRVSEISSPKPNLEALRVDRDGRVKEGGNVAAAEISTLKAKVDALERDLDQTKTFHEEAEKEKTSFQKELIGLRTEKKHLLAECQALQSQLRVGVAEGDVAEAQRTRPEVGPRGSFAAAGRPTKGLETVALVGSAEAPEPVQRLLGERQCLQKELQRCLQEMHQRELRFQQISSKAMQSAEENAQLSAQLKTVSQTLRDNQLRYTDLQNRYVQLEREYQTQVTSSVQVQGEPQAQVPPGAPQEKAAVIVEIDNVELSELRKRLAEVEMQHASAHQSVSQLSEALSREKNRREAAEEALGLSEAQMKRSTPPREYAIQMDSDEEREALIINSSEHILVRKVKGGSLSFRRWIRGRSLYCSKLLTSRAKTRYLFLSYLVTLHLLVVLCLTGVL